MSNNSLDLSRTMLELNSALSQLHNHDSDEPSCSFCGKRQSDVEMLIPGNDSVHICNHCVENAAKLIAART